jgi:hypothetical protein
VPCVFNNFQRPLLRSRAIADDFLLIPPQKPCRKLTIHRIFYRGVIQISRELTVECRLINKQRPRAPAGDRNVPGLEEIKDSVKLLAGYVPIVVEVHRRPSLNVSYVVLPTRVDVL